MFRNLDNQTQQNDRQIMSASCSECLVLRVRRSTLPA